MKVGLCLSQSPEDGAGGTWQEILGMARLAEAGGADSIWLSDHFFHRPQSGGTTGYHEAWTLLSALAAATERVEIGTLVLATSFRSPGLLAKMAATADDVAGGRLILGLGCGWHEPEYRAFDIPFDHRVGRFEEALEIIVRLLREGAVTFNGRWYSLDDAIVLPAPAHRTPIMVAAGRPRMMRATARFADQWQTAWFGRPGRELPNGARRVPGGVRRRGPRPRDRRADGRDQHRRRRSRRPAGRPRPEPRSPTPSPTGRSSASATSRPASTRRSRPASRPRWRGSAASAAERSATAVTGR